MKSLWCVHEDMNTSRRAVRAGKVRAIGSVVFCAALLAPMQAQASTRSRCQSSLEEGGWTVSMSDKFNEWDIGLAIACIAVTGGAGTFPCLAASLEQIVSEVGWDLLADAASDRGAVIFGPGGLMVQAGICSKTYPIIPGVKGTDHYVYVRYKRDTSSPEPGAPDFVLQTGTALHETDATWAFAVADNRDVFAIKKSGTGSGTTEIHVLWAASGYQQFSLQTRTALHETDATWAFGVAANRDVFAIKKSGTGTGTTEIHVLSAASGYQQFSLQTGTALHETDDTWDFGVAANRDVFAIKKSGTGTGTTEIHVLSAASGYGQFSLQTGTALHETDETWEFEVAANRDVYAIKKDLTASGTTELHVLSAASGYSEFARQTATALHQTDQTFEFGLASNQDVFAIKKSGTGTGTTEIHVLR